MEYIDVILKSNSIDLYGYIAATLTTFAFLPQLIKTWKEKSARDVSLFMLVLFISGLVLWIVYGWESHSYPVIIANIITLILNLIILILKIKYEYYSVSE